MFYISEITNHAPNNIENELQGNVYKTLDLLNIPYELVTTDEAITMDDCVLINQKLQMNMVKTLFLCNRQKTEFYLFITFGNKPFNSKAFSNALGISRISFAPSEFMTSMLGTVIGAATIFSSLLKSASDVHIVMDKDVTKEKWYGCSDGTTTGYMKISVSDIIDVFVPYTGHSLSIIEIQ